MLKVPEYLVVYNNCIDTLNILNDFITLLSGKAKTSPENLYFLRTKLNILKNIIIRRNKQYEGTYYVRDFFKRAI